MLRAGRRVLMTSKHVPEAADGGVGAGANERRLAHGGVVAPVDGAVLVIGGNGVQRILIGERPEQMAGERDVLLHAEVGPSGAHQRGIEQRGQARGGGLGSADVLDADADRILAFLGVGMAADDVEIPAAVAHHGAGGALAIAPGDGRAEVAERSTDVGVAEGRDGGGDDAPFGTR